MVSHSNDPVLVDPQTRTDKVEVTPGPNGGWNVTAISDGRVIVMRHSADWHRAERAREWMESEFRTHGAGALLAFARSQRRIDATRALVCESQNGDPRRP